MIVVGCRVVHRLDARLQGEVVWLSPWRRLCRIRITSRPVGNKLRVGQEYDFPTEDWGEAGMQDTGAEEA
ncbi:MAG: hypothetical protein WC977_14290 [Anaerovoracaceae bacterium]